MADEHPSFLARLKQHHLYGVVVAYAVVVGFLIQLVSRAFPYLGWAGAVPVIVIVLLLGFPVVIVLAWLLIEPKKDAARPDAWQRRHWKLSALVTAVVIALVVISGFYALQFSRTHISLLEGQTTTNVQAPVTASAASTPAVAIPAKSIAVLPFENLSADKNNAYFADGMQDMILTKLAGIGDLKVIARTSTAQYASHPGNLAQIGEQLGVETILEGSVQKAGNQVLINVQLIDAKTDSHIWAQDYTRTLDNVFGVEGDVAEQIATALDAKLSPAQTASLAAVPTQNQAAYDLFLRAEYQANQGGINYDRASWKAAIPLYRQAVQQDPNFALAWARLSYDESILAWFGGGGEDVKQLNQQALADAKRALQLAPNLAAAHLAIGYCDYYGRQDYAAALKAFAAALKLKPNDADTIAAQGYVQRRQGRFDAAIASLQQAVMLDPRNSGVVSTLGRMYMGVRRYDDAEKTFQRAQAIDPNNLSARIHNSVAILFGTGDVPRALAAAQGDNLRLKYDRISLLILERKYREALALLDSIPDTPDNFSADDSEVQRQADIYWLKGDKVRARRLYAQDLPKVREQLKAQPDDRTGAIWESIADDELGLDHTAEALAAVAKARVITDKSGRSEFEWAGTQHDAELSALSGRADLAIPLLSKMLTSPGAGEFYSPVLLWLDPRLAPIRDDPSFQALLKKYSKYKPAVIYPTPSAVTAE